VGFLPLHTTTTSGVTTAVLLLQIGVPPLLLEQNLVCVAGCIKISLRESHQRLPVLIYIGIAILFPMQLHTPDLHGQNLRDINICGQARREPCQPIVLDHLPGAAHFSAVHLSILTFEPATSSPQEFTLLLHLLNAIPGP
jgi:hypothetical protein